MKRTIVLFTAVLISIICIIPPAQAERIGIDAGIEYRSEYFWRGFSFYAADQANEQRGVYFPWLGYGIGGFYFSVAGEVPASRVGDNQPTDQERGWYGVDFTAKFSHKLFDDALTVGLKAQYFWYPNSQDVNEEVNGEGKDWRNDIAEAAGWFTINAIPLNPTILVSYYYRPDDHDGERENAKDIYTQFSLSHGFTLVEGATLTLGGSVGYFYYASYETAEGDPREGVSDIIGYMKLSVAGSSGITVDGSYNYAYVPDKDFYMANGYKEKHHHWVTFGVTYSI